MVKKENSPLVSNSLLQTASTKKLGAGKIALQALRSNVRPPLKKVSVPRSQDSRVSELSDPVEGVAAPAVKEIRYEDISVESSILEMSLTSGNSTNFSVSKAYGGGQVSSLGKAVRMTPQPQNSYPKPLSNERRKPLQKKSMEIQKGITFNAPSPMTLDRIQVQMGQEHSAPESREYLEKQKEITKKKEEETKKALYQKAKEETKRMVQEELQRELGEGFEAPLEGFSPEAEEEVEIKKKSLVKKILGKIRPKSPKKKKQGTEPLNASEARSLARRALLSTRQKSSIGNKDLHHLQAPVTEVLVTIKEDSVSDLDASAKQFPVNEIRMDDDEQARDDASVSTLGTPQIFGRPPQNSDLRDPTPTENFIPKKEEVPPQQENSDPNAAKRSIAQADGKKSDSRLIHRNGQALLDQVDSISNTAPTEGTEAIEKRLGSYSSPNNDKTWKTTEQASQTPKRETTYFSPFNCLGRQQDALSEKEVMETTEQTIELHGLPKPQMEADGVIAIETNSHKLLEDHDGNRKEGTVLSPTSAFNQAIDAAILQAEAEMQGRDSISGIQKVLTPIDEEEPTLSPRSTASGSENLPGRPHNKNDYDRMSLPELEAEGSPVEVIEGTDGNIELGNIELEANPDTSKKRTGSKEKVIDVIDLTSVPSGCYEDQSNEFAAYLESIEKSKSPVSFDDFMDIAASKLALVAEPSRASEHADRYATERDDDNSPKHVIVGEHVDLEGSRKSIPIVQGVEVSNPTKTEDTPKARGGNKGAFFDDDSNERNLNDSLSSNLETSNSTENDQFVLKSTPNRKVRDTGRQDEHAGELAAASPRSDRDTSKSNGFKGYFSDGLFDLLSTDESAKHHSKSRLANRRSADREMPITLIEKGLASGLVRPEDTARANSHKAEGKGDVLDSVFEYSETMICGKGKEGSLDRQHLESTEKTKPSFAMMCGAVPLYLFDSAKRGVPDSEKPNEKYKYENKESQGRGKTRDMTPSLCDSQSTTDEELPVPVSRGDRGRPKIKSPIQQETSSDHESLDSVVKLSAAEANRSAKLSPTARMNKREEIATTEMQDNGTNSTSHSSKSSGLNRQGPPMPERVGTREKVLLEQDDVYWDTLSTIASTKEKSAATEKATPIETTKPGPIPVEITMTSEKSSAPILSDSAVDSFEKKIQVQQSIQKLNTLIEEENMERNGRTKTSNAESPRSNQEIINVVDVEKKIDEQIDALPSNRAAGAGSAGAGTGKYSPSPRKKDLHQPVSLVRDDNSEPSLSYSLETSEVKKISLDGVPFPEKVPSRRSRHSDGHMSRVGSISGDEPISEPPSRFVADDGKSTDSASRSSNVAGLVAMFEAALTNKGEGSASAPQIRFQDRSRNHQDRGLHDAAASSNSSDNNSDLLLAVTRSATEETKSDDGKEAFAENSRTNPLYVEDSPNNFASASRVSDRHGNSSAVTSSAHAEAMDESYIRSERQRVVAHQEQSSYSERPERTGYIDDDMRNHVKWGFEEIYEPQDEAEDDSSSKLGNPNNSANMESPFRSANDSSQIESFRNSSTLPASEGHIVLNHGAIRLPKDSASRNSRSIRTPQDRISGPNNRLGIVSEGAQAGEHYHEASNTHCLLPSDQALDPTDVDMDQRVDDMDLISRTIQLSRELLSSMSAKDIEEADDEVVKSLMSFGTEDSQKFSLSLGHQYPGPTSPSETLGTEEDSQKFSLNLGPQQPEPVATGHRHGTSSSVSAATKSTEPGHYTAEGIVPSSVTLRSRPLMNERRSWGSSLHHSNQTGPEHSTVQHREATLSRDSISIPTRSEVSSNSPMNVEKLFSKYDNFASQLIEQNDKLKSGHGGESPNDMDGGSNFTPQVLNRLDELRSQRAQALSRFQGSRSQQQVASTEEKAKDRLRYYLGGYGSPSLQSGSTRTPPQPLYMQSHPPANVGVPYSGGNTRHLNNQSLGSVGHRSNRDADSVSTSGSSATAPSKKARELRHQLDEALKASKEIRMTQEKLGSELRNFKTKFYQKNEELEGQAFRAMTGE